MKVSRHFWTRVWASLLAVLLLAGGAAHAFAQRPDFKFNENSLNSEPQVTLTRKGNLDVAPVRLEGRTVLIVSERTPESSDTGTAPIELRVQRIELRLQDLLQFLSTIVQKDPEGFDPAKLSVTVSTLNRQTVILAAYTDLLRPREVTTITDQDVEANWQYSTARELAEAESKNIRQALLRALAERQPQSRQKQFLTGLLTLMSLIVTSGLLYLIQRWLNIWQRRLQNQLPQPSLTGEPSGGEPPAHQTYRPSPGSIPSRSKWPRRLPPWLGPMIPNLDKPGELIQFIRWQLWNLQALTWLLGLVYVCLRVPEFRTTGQWLLRLPLSLLLTCVGALILKEVCQICITIGLRQWAQRLAQNPLQSGRVGARVATIASALKELTNLLILLGSTLFFLAIIQVPVQVIVIVAGVLAFLAQDLLKNWISGCQILLEDQFALGDLIRLANVTGIVEYLSLRITRIRTPDGELCTFANGSFTQVANLSSQWSCLNLRIHVAATTDLELAIALSNQTAEEMRTDPVWRTMILEPATVLGIDGFGRNRVTIRVVIKTQPLKQSDVGREYRRRLKQAFDQAAITLV